jgi:hypothetical protein
MGPRVGLYSREVPVTEKYSTDVEAAARCNIDCDSQASMCHK